MKFSQQSLLKTQNTKFYLLLFKAVREVDVQWCRKCVTQFDCSSRRKLIIGLLNDTYASHRLYNIKCYDNTKLCIREHNEVSDHSLVQCGIPPFGLRAEKFQKLLQPVQLACGSIFEPKTSRVQSRIARLGVAQLHLLIKHWKCVNIRRI